MKITIDRSGRAEQILIEGASQSDILPGIWRNFRGEKRNFNEAGKRNFNLALNDLPAGALDDLASTGLRIKERAGNEEYGDEPLRYAKVNVALGGKIPPALYLVTGKRMHELSENELALLDGARFSNVDLVLRCYHRDESSCTLYLQKGYFTIQQDPIEAKYASMDLGDDDTDEEIPF